MNEAMDLLRSFKAGWRRTPRFQACAKMILETKSKSRRRLKKRSDATADARTPAAKAGRPFRIIGIGTSAGGLDALEHFLHHVPRNNGLAFVIVQHLDPTREGVLPELLQRNTSMKVVQVKDRTRVQAERVYVIPSNKDMSILHGVLHLLEPSSPRGLRLPIDFFLRSLAQDQQKQSIGVILSGMGSDGTLGLRAIKEMGGVVLVQDPATAKFDGMPRSAINSGLADIVASVNDLPGRILAYLQRTSIIPIVEPEVEDKTQSAMETVVRLLRAHTGHDFSHYKKNTLYRRLERRRSIHQIDKIADYIRYLQENPHELNLLFKELLIGVTSFFRDPAAWEELRKKIFPALIANQPANSLLRAWVPACSTGEEAYSLAMVFREAMEKFKPRKNMTLQVFATDLDEDAISNARVGAYPDNICADVSPKRMSRFFSKEEYGCRVSAEIREMVIFAVQSLILDPPFIKLDILSCRNLLIYLSPEIQKKIMPLFHYSLNPGGILFLGSAETLGTFTNLFTPINTKLRLFRRTPSIIQPEPIEFPSSFASPLPNDGEAPPPPKQHRSLQSLADRLVLQRYCPPVVLVNDKGDILYVSGRTGKYLEPASGKANWNIFVMAREGLRYELGDAFHEALKREDAVAIRRLKVGIDGGHQYVDVTLQRLAEPDPLQGLVMIVFTDVAAPVEIKPPPPSGKAEKNSFRNPRMEELERKFQQARMDAQAIREEMQTSQEELRSTNEEQQSTNEELQSTNEELTTSKEEMQSLNEELQTVNNELQTKVDELSRSNNDIKNLLNSTDIATLFLDKNLNVRRFTTQATNIIKLIPGDLGRPITDLASDLLYPDLTKDAREVLHRLGFIEKSINARNGRWFTVRIMPYRTLDDRIDGVVITFMDITKAKALETQLREKHALLEKNLAKQSASGQAGKPAPLKAISHKRAGSNGKERPSRKL
jgi:two-component system CheB/CheR fusion protein